jgi:hypothetical protein
MKLDKTLLPVDILNSIMTALNTTQSLGIDLNKARGFSLTVLGSGMSDSGGHVF